MPYTYETNGAAIYKASFRTIRSESDFERFNQDEEKVAVRMIHAAGMVGLAEYIHFSEGFAQKAVHTRKLLISHWSAKVVLST